LSEQKIVLPLICRYFYPEIATRMNRLEIQHAIFNTLPQLSEVQLIKLLDFINDLLSIKKSKKENKSPLPGKHQVKILTDESFDLALVGFPPVLLSKNTFITTVKVSKVEKLKPTIILE
jgi:hypothetical protein